MEPSKQPAVAKSLPNRDVQNLKSGIGKLKRLISQENTTNTIAMKNKIKKIKELPDEIWLKVMKYCSTSELEESKEGEPWRRNAKDGRTRQ